MKARPTLFTLLVTVALNASAAESDGWITLFNGRNLDGWTQHGGKAIYRVDDDQIVGVPVPNTPNSFLCTQRTFKDFILELEFKPMTGLNSGVQVRSEVFPEARSVQAGGKTFKIPADRVHGYQIEIDPSERAWTGGIYDEGRRGWLKDLKDNEPARKAFKANDWNRFRIECRGDTIKTWLNGVPAAEIHDDMTPAGLIALQVHGIGKDPKQLEVRWRNLRLKDLSTPAFADEREDPNWTGPAYQALPALEGQGWQYLFDGKSLDGWRVTDFAGHGSVGVKGGRLEIEMGAMLTGVNLVRTNDMPQSGYELALDAMKVDGSDFFCALTFPVGESCCSFVVGGWGGGVVGISSIDGNDASSNETTKFKDFEKNKWFRIRVRVTGEKIEAWIGKEKMVDVLLEDRRIAVRPGEIEDSQPLGIATYQTSAAFRNIQWRPLK